MAIPMERIAELVNRGRAPAYDGGTTPVVNQKCIRDGYLDLSHLKYTNEVTKPLPEWVVLRENDVVITSTGRGTIGRSALIGGGLGRVTCDSHVTIVRPDRSRVEPRYLAAVLAQGRDALEALATGSTNQTELNRASISSFRVPLPPLEEQRRIADLVDHIDEAIRCVADARDSGESALSVVRESLLARHEFQKRHLGHLLDGIDAGRSPRCEDRRPGRGEVGVLKVSAVRFNEFDPSESKTLPAETDFSRDHLVSQGDLLMTRANGSLHLVGAVCRVDDDPPNLLLSDKTLRLRVDESQVARDFALHVLLSRSLRTQIERDATGSSGQKNISQRQIKRLVVPVPDLESQRLIAETLEALASELRARKNELRALHTLRPSVLARLLGGDHRIPESYDRLLVPGGVASELETAAV